jgi:hypothetical protein
VLPAHENPFRMRRIEALRYRLDHDGWDRLLARFAAHGWRGLLVGPHGSGKTTLREEIETRLRRDGWQVRALVLGDERMIAWTELHALVQGADRRTLLSLDGIDRLGPLTWWRLRRLAVEVGGILATSHVPGRLPVLHRHHTSAALLRDLVHEVIGDRHDPTLLDRRCDDLFVRHRGDLRACLRALYDEAADQHAWTGWTVPT